MKTYERWYGSPYDRGAADAYYWRPKNPHYYPNGTYIGQPITNLSSEELEAYNAGYDEESDRKDFGD